MVLEQKLKKSVKLLHEILPFISAWDVEVIKGDKITHPWFEELTKMSPDQAFLFDGKRDYQTLKSPSWLKTISEINEISSFPQIESSEIDLELIGKKKKRHELAKLYHLLKPDQKKSIVDFGGGVGNLAYFLEKNLAMNVHVLEQDSDLIATGLEKVKKRGSHITFSKCFVDNSSSFIPTLENAPLSIGLHTCGNFANNMLKKCHQHNVKKIINFGCCYSKIQDDDYHLSHLSDKNLYFNQRALSIATLGYSPVTKEIYDYRLKIMKYKFSFYNWLHHEYGDVKFLPMSNARRTLYDQSFSQFVLANMTKFLPARKIPQSESLETFYQSGQNLELNQYFQNYYAIARYFGKLLETYLLCDRALYLQENGYEVKIMSVFNPAISPRNKAIIATKL